MRRQQPKNDRQRLFKELLGEFGDKAYSFAMQLTQDEGQARDLVQEAFVKAFDRLDEYDSQRPFYSWFASLLHNIYVDSVRRAEFRHVVSMDSEEEDIPALLAKIPEPGRAMLDLLLDRESDLAVKEALRGLEPEMRTALALCDIEGYSYEEASAVMNCPLGTIRSRVARARARLKELMTPYMEVGEVRHASV